MRKLYRNISVVTVIFMIALAAMLGVSYYQMQQVSPLQTEVMETLKTLNESNGDNESLQQQIRQLDLISRKAYFVQEGQLKAGVYILLAMALILTVCLNMYFKESMNLPEKELDPIDEWMNKTRARKYISWAASAAAIVALGIVILQNIDFKKAPADSDDNVEALLAENTIEENEQTEAVENVVFEQNASETTTEDATTEEVQAESSAEEAKEETPEVEELPVPKITSKSFRGNSSSSTSSARGIATSWDLKSKKNILWQSAPPKHGYNSPVITGRNVFITGADEEARELYCYDVYTGELKWTVKADNIPGSPSAMPRVNGDTGLAASTVATNGNQVCAIFATGDIICADMDGKRLWAKNIGLPDNHYGYASSLQMYGKMLFIQYQNNEKPQVIALNAETGNQIWTKTAKDKIAWSSPIIATVDKKPILVAMGNPAIAAYSATNGDELWRVECMSGEVGSSPAFADGLVYGASEYSVCVAIDAATGEKVWEATDYLPECSSLAANKDFVVCATSYGVVCAWDAKTGELKAEHDVSDPFYSSPMFVDGKLYIFANSGKVYIFSAKDMSLVTSFDTGEKTFATPAFTDGMMIVRTDNSIYCVKK